MNTQVQPVVNAANLDPEELAAWLSRMSRDAEASMQDYSMLLFELNSAERSLRYVSENLATRINFLSGPEIIRSVDHSTAIQEDLHLLREIEQSIRDFHQAIEPCLSRFAELQERRTRQAKKGAHPAVSGQEMQEFDPVHSGEGPHPHEACE